MKDMEELVANLASIHRSMPATWTAVNIQLLKMKFLEYKTLVAILPEKYTAVKTQCEQYFDLITARIDAIETNAASRLIARNYFQEAVDHIRSQIDMVLTSLQTAAG